MLLMGTNAMVTAGDVTATGTVDTDFDPAWLVNGDLHRPVKVTGDAALTVSGGQSVLANGIALVGHNLDAGVIADFGVFGSVVAPALPANGIQLNPFAVGNDITATGFEFAVTGNSGPLYIGGAFVGAFSAVRALPPGPTFQFKGFGTPDPGEFAGLAYAKGGESRLYGGRVILTDTEVQVMLAAWRASEENSNPTIIVPFPDETNPLMPGYGAWAVIWDTFEPQPIQPADPGQEGLWGVNVLWRELTRYSWPA